MEKMLKKLYDLSRDFNDLNRVLYMLKTDRKYKTISEESFHRLYLKFERGFEIQLLDFVEDFLESRGFKVIRSKDEDFDDDFSYLDELDIIGRWFLEVIDYKDGILHTKEALAKFCTTEKFLRDYRKLATKIERLVCKNKFDSIVKAK